jgi:LacI family transcriptional regulator
MPKIDRIIQLLETRIERGDYAMTALPTEYGLAAEVGVGRMTARRALLHLVDKGLLHRDGSGKLVVTAERLNSRPLHIGFVTATLSNAALRWHKAAEQVVSSHGGYLRVITYFHWDDPVLLEAIESFDGVFLVPPAEALPPKLAERLLGSRARLVVLGADYSALGLRSLDIVAPGSVEALLDHLFSLGHRHISAFNSQSMDGVIEERLAQWAAWLQKHGLNGELINEPIPPYGDPQEKAYTVAAPRLMSGQGLGGTALFCTTLPAALGAIQAITESGLQVGRDISICTVDEEGMGRFVSPQLTSTLKADPLPFLRASVDWMLGGQWSGPLLKRTDKVDIFAGGTAGPAPRIAVSQPKRHKAQ